MADFTQEARAALVLALLVVFKAEIPHCSIGSGSGQVHCEPFQVGSNLVACDTNLDGLSTAVVSHACNALENAQLHDLVIMEIFDSLALPE